MTTYCKGLTRMGHGENAVCGDRYYGDTYQCASCALIDSKSAHANTAEANTEDDLNDRFQTHPKFETHRLPPQPIPGAPICAARANKKPLSHDSGMDVFHLVFRLQFSP